MKVAAKGFDGLSKAVKFVKDNMNILLPVIAGITAAVVAQMVINGLVKAYKAWQIATRAQTTLQWLLNAAMNANPFGLVALAIGALIAVGVLLWKNWDTVKEVASIVWDKIVEVWNVVADWFYNNVIQPLADFFSGLWDSIVNIFTGVVSWFSNKFSEAWQAIKNVFSGIGSFFGGIWDTIKQQFTNIGSAIGDAIGGAFKYVVNSIINFAENTINGFIRAINGAIGMINNIPGVEIGYLNELSIPRLAKGGIVDSAQMFVAGEAGKEAVMPLENNTGWITQLAEKVATRMPQGSDNSSISGDIIFMMDSSVIGKVALSQLRKMQRQGNITLFPT
jgi:phage-related protein